MVFKVFLAWECGIWDLGEWESEEPEVIHKMDDDAQGMGSFPRTTTTILGLDVMINDTPIPSRTRPRLSPSEPAQPHLNVETLGTRSSGKLNLLPKRILLLAATLS